MARLVVLQQVTLDDLLAEADRRGLDFLEFLRCAKPLLSAPEPDDEFNVVRCFYELEWDELESADIDPGWRDLVESVRAASPLLVHRGCRNIRDWLKPKLGDRYARQSIPLARALFGGVNRTSWDGRERPSDVLGAGTSVEELVENIAQLISDTPGAEVYLAHKREERALGILATTLSSILRDVDYCQRSPRTGKRVVRADMYEAAVRSMKLEQHFQIVRRLMEVDHDEHIAIQTEWPTPGDLVRPLGFLEQRGNYLTMGSLPPLTFL